MAKVKGQKPAGRRARTSRAEVVAAAVDICDREGADSLTIRRLASACGLSPMGVYRYIRDREELLDLVVQFVLEELPRRAPTGTWQQKTARLFSGFRAMALRHPGVSALGIARATPVPAMARFTEQALAIMDEAGFRGSDAVLAYDSLLMFTIGSIVWQAPRSGGERAGLLQAAASEGVPATHLMRHAQALAARDPDSYFDYGLSVIIAGLAAESRSREPGASKSSRAR